MKDLRPEEDEGVYTLKSDHLILDTPAITVVPGEEKPQTETTIVEEETITITPNERPETKDKEVGSFLAHSTFNIRGYQYVRLFLEDSGRN